MSMAFRYDHSINNEYGYDRFRSIQLISFIEQRSRDSNNNNKGVDGWCLVVVVYVEL